MIEPDLVPLNIRRVPRQVRLNFHLACLSRGTTMREEVIKFISKFPTGERRKSDEE